MDAVPPSPPGDVARRRLRAYGGWGLVLLVAALVAAGLVATAPPPAGAVEGDEGEDPLTDPVAFAETVYANVCAECHGGEGEGARVPGTDEEAPALAGNPDVDIPYLDLVLRTGRMPPPGDPFDNRARHVAYTQAEREALVAWIAEAFDLEGEVPEVGEGTVARGLEVYSLNCAHCHGNAGAGGTAGADTWTPSIHHLSDVAVVEAIRVGPFEMPAFSAEQITEQEAADVAAYLRSVEEAPGTPVFGLVELNPVFASAFVGLLALALLGSLLYIGGRPIPFERVPDEQIPTTVRRPTGTTPMPGDPRYDEPMHLDKEQDHVPLPYTDEGKGDPTSGDPEAVPADEQGADEPGAPPPDPPHGQPGDHA